MHHKMYIIYRYSHLLSMRNVHEDFIARVASSAHLSQDIGFASLGV